MLHQVENYLLDIWEQYDVKPKQPKQVLKSNNPNINHKPAEVKNINFIPQNKGNGQPPLNNACRKLFEDSIELVGETSPQFKNI